MADESKDRGVASVKEIGLDGKAVAKGRPEKKAKEKKVKAPFVNPFSRKRPARGK